MEQTESQDDTRVPEDQGGDEDLATEDQGRAGGKEEPDRARGME